MNATMQLMHAAGAQGQLGPGEFTSQSAVINFLVRKPLALCVMDEFGAFLKKVTSKSASIHEINISKILRSLWGTSFAPMPTAEWASRKMEIIQSPAISILGLSTSDEFHAALQGDSVDNGFLNRFLVLSTSIRGADREPDVRAVPESLATSLRALFEWKDHQAFLIIDNPKIVAEPDVLLWASPQALKAFQEFERLRDEQIDAEPGLAAYMARVGEIAIRLATIRAAARWGPGAKVDRSDMEWGAGLAWTAGKALADEARGYLPGNERNVYFEKLLGLIRRRVTPVKVRDIQQYLRGRLRAQEIRELLGAMVEIGEIVKTEDGCYRPADEV
jgi:hypothetical protein